MRITQVNSTLVSPWPGQATVGIPRFSSQPERQPESASRIQAGNPLKLALALLIGTVGMTGAMFHASTRHVAPHEVGIKTDKSGNTDTTPLKTGKYLVAPGRHSLYRYDTRPQTVSDNVIVDLRDKGLQDTDTRDEKPLGLTQINRSFEVKFRIADPQKLPRLHEALTRTPPSSGEMPSNIHLESLIKGPTSLTGAYKKPLAEQIENPNNRRIYERLIAPEIKRRIDQALNRQLAKLERKKQEYGQNPKELDNLDISNLVMGLFNRVSAPSPWLNAPPSEPAADWAGDLKTQYGIEIIHLTPSSIGGWSTSPLPAR